MDINIAVSGLKPKNSKTGFDIAAIDELHEYISANLVEVIGNVLNTAKYADINLVYLEWDQDVFHITIKSSDTDGRRHRTEHQVEVIKSQ